MILGMLIESAADLSKITGQQLRLVPCDGTDKWINLDVSCNKLQYGTTHVLTSTNPRLVDRVLIVNSRRVDTFLKKLKKYEDLDADGWKLDEWSFDYTIRLADRLRSGIKRYLEGIGSSDFSTGD